MWHEALNSISIPLPDTRLQQFLCLCLFQTKTVSIVRIPNKRKPNVMMTSTKPCGSGRRMPVCLPSPTTRGQGHIINVIQPPTPIKAFASSLMSPVPLLLPSLRYLHPSLSVSLSHISVSVRGFHSWMKAFVPDCVSPLNAVSALTSAPGGQWGLL